MPLPQRLPPPNPLAPTAFRPIEVAPAKPTKKRLVPMALGPVGSTAASVPATAEAQAFAKASAAQPMPLRPIGAAPAPKPSGVAPIALQGADLADKLERDIDAGRLKDKEEPTKKVPKRPMISVEECDRRMQEQQARFDAEVEQLESMARANLPSHLKKLDAVADGIAERYNEGEFGDDEEVDFDEDGEDDEYDIDGDDDDEGDVEVDLDKYEDADNYSLEHGNMPVSISKKKRPAQGVATSSGGLSTPLKEFNSAKARANEQGLVEFEWKGVRYVKGTWANGVSVWKRADGQRASKPSSPCNRHTTRDPCVQDVAGCRFSEKTERRRAYCAKKRVASPGGSKAVRPTTPPVGKSGKGSKPVGAKKQPVVTGNTSKKKKKKMSTTQLIKSHKLYPHSKYPRSKK